MTSTPLTCREVVEIVSDYLEGALDDDERRRLEDHLDGCKGCRAYVEQVRAAIELSGKPAAESLSPQLEQKLVEAFRGFRRRPSS